MQVTATEFKKNIGKYYKLVEHHDIYITKNGKEVAMLTRPKHNRVALLNNLVGVLPKDANINEDDLKTERLARQ